MLNYRQVKTNHRHIALDGVRWHYIAIASCHVDTTEIILSIGHLFSDIFLYVYSRKKLFSNARMPTFSRALNNT